MSIWNLCTNVYSRFIHNCWKLKATTISLNRWMNSKNYGMSVEEHDQGHDHDHHKLTHELNLSTWRVLTPTSVLRMSVPLAFPPSRVCSKDKALRWWCDIEDTCMVYMIESISGLFISLKDLEGVWGDLFILLPSNTSLICDFHFLLLKLSPTNLERPASFFGLSLPFVW